MNYEGLGLTPMIFQQLIHKAYDLRVTVIGKKVFGCKIVSEKMDWRTAQSEPETLYTPFDLSDEITSKCLLMNQQLGLNFGAYDFAYSNDGKLVFLEINPNGQWGFVEDRTGLPLSKAMAEVLIGSL
ncbi:MAG: RimK domain protein ATP-grasp [candidate division WS6 bacterium GW2011_GWF2_39_15]|uniref:RimK domain protein ATP-grasp n=1 Tax=candidate division WS6 bacterium GW2011_GWF2_39_15 TaxID=1619100 RepID=A0A0G0MQE9_9BACT|nr:MAG: RimK domain protein ATP-grasp [candidate division WS6 bacterium GW2011_GWF2_39_15]